MITSISADGGVVEVVLVANVQLSRSGLARGNFGNVSGIDRHAGIMVIKPSGVPYKELRHNDLAQVAVVDGIHLSGLRPSSDTRTHLELYRAFQDIGGIAHAHSVFATSWAQAGRSIPCLGTTHADNFHGNVPCSRPLVGAELGADYEEATGRVIIEAIGDRNALEVPAVLVASHGAFVWGIDALDAVDNAAALEEVAMMASQTLALRQNQDAIPGELLDRHYWRKHGPSAYYGQVRVEPGTEASKSNGASS